MTKNEISAADWKTVHAVPKPGKKHKLGAKRTIVDGETFPSGMEAQLYGKLCIAKSQREIRDIERYPNVKLTQANIPWSVDFVVWNIKENRHEWHESHPRGMGADFRIKRQLWTVYGPGPLHLYDYDKRTKKVEWVETIIPRGEREPC